MILEKIAELVQEKRIEGISDLRDESDREGMRIVIELKRDAIAQVVLNQLFKHTQMQISFGIILLGILHGQPVILNIRDLIEQFINHRKEGRRLADPATRQLIAQGLADGVTRYIRSVKTAALARPGRPTP